MEDNIDRVYVSIVSEEDQVSRRFYICRKDTWDKMDQATQHIEIIDRLKEAGIIIQAEDSSGTSMEDVRLNLESIQSYTESRGE